MATIARVSIAPVKGLGLVHPDEVEVELTGVLANRRFHIVDGEGRRYNQLRNGELVRIRPDYDAQGERLTLRFPDGAIADGEVVPGEEIVTDFYGRPVRGRLVEGPWSEALSSWAGRSLRLVQSAPGDAIDRGRGHVSIISRASLDELAQRAGRDAVDGRRFRMLFELDGCRPHQEDEWIGRCLRVGDALVKLRGDVARCAITTQNPDTGKRDFDTLRTIAGYRKTGTTEAGKKSIPFGVFGEVVDVGRVRIGDAVEPVELSLLDATA